MLYEELYLWKSKGSQVRGCMGGRLVMMTEWRWDDEYGGKGDDDDGFCCG